MGHLIRLIIENLHTGHWIYIIHIIPVSYTHLDVYKRQVVGGLSNNGKLAVCLGILIMLGVSLWNMPKTASVPVEAAK